MPERRRGNSGRQLFDHAFLTDTEWQSILATIRPIASTASYDGVYKTFWVLRIIASFYLIILTIPFNWLSLPEKTAAGPGGPGPQGTPTWRSAPRTLRSLDSQQPPIAFGLDVRQRFRAAQHVHHFQQAAVAIQAMPAAFHVALHLLAAAPGRAAVDHIEECLGREALLRIVDSSLAARPSDAPLSASSALRHASTLPRGTSTSKQAAAPIQAMPAALHVAPQSSRPRL
jgi:hypothetical protein